MVLHALVPFLAIEMRIALLADPSALAGQAIFFVAVETVDNGEKPSSLHLRHWRARRITASLLAAVGGNLLREGGFASYGHGKSGVCPLPRTA